MSDFIGGSLIILSVGAVIGFWIWLAARSKVQRRSAEAVGPDLSQRLAAIEQRLTDTQDVMLALSEKMDRWEQERHGPAVG